MAADDAARSSRRMDLNLYLGLPRAPRARRPDLGSDLVLGTPMMSSSSPSSSAASADAPPLEMDPLHPPYSPPRADLASPPTPAHEPFYPPEAHPPYVPPPLPVPGAMPVLADELDFHFSEAHLCPVRRTDRPSSSTASSSFRPEQDERYRRLISFSARHSRYLRPRRFRSDLPPLSAESLGNDVAAQPPEPEPIRDTLEENKVVADGAIVGDDSGTELGKSSAMFECNICFDMAGEPVVTSCGHLFCWSCLYQWLHVHSSHKECPVCKGEVTEGNITPIYGRGNSGSDVEKKVAEDGNASDLKIPPRPHGNRLESFRQQLRPMSRRLGEAHGILSTWRRILDQHLVNSVSRVEGPLESTVQERASHFSRVATRLRARRLLREAEDPTFGASSARESGPPESNIFDLPRRNSSSLSHDGMDLLRHLAFAGVEDSERLATAVSDLRQIARPSHFGASTSSNPPNPESVDGAHVAVALTADQASNSSTMAVIQEDAAFTESAGEPSNAGSSRSLRRSRRSEALASLDVDGADLHRNKRRRLN